MKKIFGFITFLSLFFVLGASIFATETKVPRVVIIPESQVLNQSFYVNAGETVTIAGVVNGDVIVAGGNVFIPGVVNGDVLTAGGTVSIPGTVTQDIRAVGGQISVRGSVDGNVTALGGSIEVSDESFIAGGVLAVGGSVFISADILGDTIVVGGNTVIDNATIAGNVETYSETAHIGPDVIIGGNLVYALDSQTTISNDASISGQINTKVFPETAWDSTEITRSRGFDERIAASVIAFAMVSLVGLVALKFFPMFFEKIPKVSQKSPVKTFLKGLGAIILWPVVSILILITIIGIPLGVVSLAIYVIMLYISKLFVAYPLGILILEKRFKKTNMYLALLIGLAVYYMLRMIPVIGGLTALFVTVYGMGIFLNSFKSFSRKD